MLCNKLFSKKKEKKENSRADTLAMTDSCILGKYRDRAGKKKVGTRNQSNQTRVEPWLLNTGNKFKETDLMGS